MEKAGSRSSSSLERRWCGKLRLTALDASVGKERSMHSPTHSRGPAHHHSPAHPYSPSPHIILGSVALGPSSL